MKIQLPSQIRTEDFDPENKNLIDKLSGIINTFMNDVTRVINGNVDFDNMARQLVNVTVTMDSTGAVINSPQIRTNLNRKVIGVNVVNALNVINPTIYPTTAPFVSFTINGNLVTILNITGLQANSQYTLTLELMT